MAKRRRNPYGPEARNALVTFANGFKDPQRRLYAWDLAQYMMGSPGHPQKPPIPFFMEVASAASIRRRIIKILGRFRVENPRNSAALAAALIPESWKTAMVRRLRNGKVQIKIGRSR